MHGYGGATFQLLVNDDSHRFASTRMFTLPDLLLETFHGNHVQDHNLDHRHIFNVPVHFDLLARVSGGDDLRFRVPLDVFAPAAAVPGDGVRDALLLLWVQYDAREGAVRHECHVP